MGYFALVALGLATSGVFAVVSFFVSERRHEIGVRIALGARVSDVMITVMRRGLIPVLFGLGLGMFGAFAVSRAMGSMLYRVSPHDPLTFIGIPLVLLGVALVASLVPALRAARIDPIITLRYEYEILHRLPNAQIVEGLAIERASQPGVRFRTAWLPFSEARGIRAAFDLSPSGVIDSLALGALSLILEACSPSPLNRAIA